MKRMKNLTVCLLVIVVVFSTLTALGAENTASSITADNIKNYNEEVVQDRTLQYQKVSGALENLGIYSFADADEKMTVTRGEFAKMIADLLNLQNVAAMGPARFNDIERSPYNNEIELVCYYGIMNGTGTVTFQPEEKITYKQAVKTIVTALGYKPVAESNGGYPDGYMKIAINLGLLKGSSEGLDEPITFITAANLISLSAQTPIFDVVVIEGDRAIYSDIPQRTILSVYHDVYEGKGIMTDNGITAINMYSQVGSDSCVIGGKQLVGMKNAYIDYLGCNVKYFYKNDGSTDTLLYVTTDSVNGNNIVTLRASELLVDDSKFSADKVVAEINGKKRSYNIYKYADFIYNGVFDATFHNNSMKIKSGTLTLVDADSDNVYEVVKAWEYSDVVVNNVVVTDEKILSKYSESMYSQINYGDYKVTLFEDSDGNEIEPEKIFSGCVLSVFTSKNGEFIKGIVSGDVADITISSMDTDSANVKLFYNENVEAELSYTFYKLMSSDPASYKLPKAGSSYKVLFNYDGYITMLTELEGKEEYAYVLSMGYGQGMRSGKVDVKLYFESNSSAIVPVADKIKINGIKNKTGADLIADRRIYNNGAVIPQLVKITLNSKGELNSIWIDDVADSGKFGFNLEEFSLDFASEGYPMNDLAVSGMSDRFVYRSYRVTENTKIFLVFGTDKYIQTSDEEQIKVISYLDYVGTSGNKYIKMYDADSRWNCGAVVISETIGFSGRAFTINKVSHIVDEDGEDKLSVACFTQGVYKVLREDDGGRLSAEVIRRYPESNGEVYVGDVFELFLDVNGEICNAKMIYSPKRDNDQEYCFVDIYHSSSGALMNTNNQIYMLGYPVFVENGVMGVYTNANPAYVPLPDSSQSSTGSVESFFIHPIASNANLLKYDCNTGELVQITKDDLYGVGQETANGWDIFDKSTKVYFKRNSGIAYDILLVTNVGV